MPSIPTAVKEDHLHLLVFSKMGTVEAGVHARVHMCVKDRR